MNNELFQCGLCSELTPFVQKTDKLENAVQHTYAECQCCKGKTTICYTNKQIRALLYKQRNTKPGKIKQELADKIQNKMKALQKEFEE